MKIQEIEGYEILATKTDLKELRADMKELSVQIRELRVEINERFQRIRILIWLPVISSGLQILVAFLKH